MTMIYISSLLEPCYCIRHRYTYSILPFGRPLENYEIVKRTIETQLFKDDITGVTETKIRLFCKICNKNIWKI